MTKSNLTKETKKVTKVKAKPAIAKTKEPKTKEHKMKCGKKPRDLAKA